jgi:hypothetical protein
MFHAIMAIYALTTTSVYQRLMGLGPRQGAEDHPQAAPRVMMPTPAQRMMSVLPIREG